MDEPLSAERPVAPRRHSLGRFLTYVWPYTGLIVRATGCGMLKFILPSTMALSLRFLTDRLVPAQTTAAAPPGDIIALSFDRYLSWFGEILGPFWATPEGAFHLLMLTLVVVYAVWAVALYYRSQWAQLAGHRVMMDLRSDLYRHIQSLSHSFFQELSCSGCSSPSWFMASPNPGGCIS